MGEKWQYLEIGTGGGKPVFNAKGSSSSVNHLSPKEMPSAGQGKSRPRLIKSYTNIALAERTLFKDVIKRYLQEVALKTRKHAGR
jgi:hypothetical protein